MTAPSEQDPARNIVDIDTFDLYSPTGVSLQFVDSNERERQKGLWYIVKTPMTRGEEQEFSELAQQLYMPAVAERLRNFAEHMRQKRKEHQIAVRLPDLQDLTVFLESNQDRMFAIKFT